MKLEIIGELINNAYARSRRAWEARDLEGFQALAKSQTEHGSKFLDVIIDSTAKTSVKKEEAIAFLDPNSFSEGGRVPQKRAHS